MSATMKTHVVNISRGHVFDVYIGRRSSAPHRTGGTSVQFDGLNGCFANHFYDGTREENIRRFREYFACRIEADPVFRQMVLSMKGKRLGCFCAPRPCHGDVYVQWLETHDA